MLIIRTWVHTYIQTFNEFSLGSGITRQLIIWRVLSYHGNMHCGSAAGSQWEIDDHCVSKSVFVQRRYQWAERVRATSRMYVICLSVSQMFVRDRPRQKGGKVIESSRGSGEDKQKWSKWNYVTDVGNNRFYTSYCEDENCDIRIHDGCPSISLGYAGFKFIVRYFLSHELNTTQHY